ncbi:serine protease Do-like HtrB [Oxobacter pfennigii]|uniref:Serine protease Do-like HtrB n=1 Tax=Oxobacter pfennigii TaxID=36849 RepID=A0A0P8W5A8_9CLOT|nr:trypsin-like peptidase domain-containing protein [Oxobacter pfennigii]KPU42788.1 serine protease Do-like HtrB [Oxobacter pfennigii]
MDNYMDNENMDKLESQDGSDISPDPHEDGEEEFIANHEESIDEYPLQRNGSINIQNVPVRKRRFKNLAPFIASMLVSAILGGIAGGAFVNYMFDRQPLTTPLTSSINQEIPKTVNYEPPSSLIAKIAEEVGPAIVGISTTGVAQNIFGQSKVTGTGSGIIFDRKGYIITNQHVIDGGKEVTVTLAGGEKSFKAQVIGSDARSDLAVLKIEADNLPTAKLGDSDKVRVGDLAIAIGNPLGEEYAGTVTSGIISATNRKMSINDGEYDRRYKLIQTDAAINPGNSGGALINESGEVIGINTIKFIDADVEGMGFAIPVNEAKPIIDELMQNGYISRAQLGVVVVTITEDIAKEYNQPVGAGIEEVTSGGAAEAAGFKPKDIITEVNGVKIKSNEDLISELEKYKPGNSINVTVWREGKYMTIAVTLGEQRRQTS